MFKGVLQVKPDEFKRFRDLIEKKIGINFPETKKSLLESRLASHIVKLGFDSFEKYYKYLKNTDDIEEFDYFIDRITTHTTHFFRENSHFDFLINNGLKLINDHFNRPVIKILSLGASTGEEIYTLALIMYFHKKNGLVRDYEIHGADISKNALLKAKEGVFNKNQLNNIPKKYHNCFKITGETIKAKEILKNNLRFFLLNACKVDQKFPDVYHIIFCRNILIYFSKPLQQNIINNIILILNNGGLLFTGQSESLYGFTHNLKKIGSAIYQKIIV